MILKERLLRRKGSFSPLSDPESNVNIHRVEGWVCGKGLQTAWKCQQGILTSIPGALRTPVVTVVPPKATNVTTQHVLAAQDSDLINILKVSFNQFSISSKDP